MRIDITVACLYVQLKVYLPPSRKLCFHLCFSLCLSVNRIAQNSWSNLYEILWNDWT